MKRRRQARIAAKNRTKKKPKTPVLTNRQRTKQALIKAGLHLSGPERRELHTAMEKALAKKAGVETYKIGKLSDVVGKPSSYRKGKRVVQTKTITKEVPAGEKEVIGRRLNYETWEYEPVYRQRPGKTITETKVVGESFTAVRTRKKGGSKQGSSGGDRGSHKTGSMSARRIRAKTVGKGKSRRKASKGQKTRKEKKKK